MQYPSQVCLVKHPDELVVEENGLQMGVQGNLYRSAENMPAGNSTLTRSLTSCTPPQPSSCQARSGPNR